MALDGMTHERWTALSEREREALRDLSGLQPQLTPYRGWRVEVTRLDGTVARFVVEQSTGWRPCTLEVSTRRSTGGTPADWEYRSVRPLYRVR